MTPSAGNDDEDYADQDPDADCFICGGEGYLYGGDMGDPLWYGEDESYPCYSCHGTGRRADMTVM